MPAKHHGNDLLRDGRLVIRLHGFSLAPQSLRVSRGGAARSECKGWTPAVYRANRDFLQSVDFVRMQKKYGTAYSFTLTALRGTSYADFRAARAALYRWARYNNRPLYNGLQWHKSGTPHLHGIIFGDGIYSEIVRVWIRAMARRGVRCALVSQKVRPIYELRGWLRYCAHHLVGGKGKEQNIAPPEYDGGRVWHYTRHFLAYFRVREIPVLAAEYPAVRRNLKRALAASVRGVISSLTAAERKIVDLGLDFNSLLRRNAERRARVVSRRVRSLSWARAYSGVSGWLDFADTERLAGLS